MNKYISCIGISTNRLKEIKADIHIHRNKDMFKGKKKSNYLDSNRSENYGYLHVFAHLLDLIKDRNMTHLI